MKKAIIITCLVLSGLIILDSLNTAQALMMLLLAGVVPGTSFALSAQTMMSIFALLTGFVVARIMNYLILSAASKLPFRQHA